MFARIYFRYRTRKLPVPLALVLVVVLSYASFRWPIAAVSICLVLMFCASFWYPEAYLRWLRALGIVSIYFGLLSFKLRQMPFYVVRYLALGHLSILFFYLVPPASIEHPIISLSLCLLPYFEVRIRNVLLAAKVKGLPLSSRNPFVFVRAVAKFFIPVMISLFRTISEVEMALRVKGVEVSGG